MTTTFIHVHVLYTCIYNIIDQRDANKKKKMDNILKCMYMLKIDVYHVPSYQCTASSHNDEEVHSVHHECT